MTKGLIFVFLTIGSMAGAYVPSLWGADVFSLSSILWSTAGGFAGIYVGYKIGQYFE